MTSAERIAALRAAVAGMTEGEWYAQDGDILNEAGCQIADFVPFSVDRAGIVALRNEAAWLLEQAAKVERLEHEIRNANRRNHERNVALDALHFVWCSGGCESGVHRFGEHPSLTEEIVRAAVSNTRQLVQWLENAEGRKLDNAGIKARWEEKERLERVEAAARAYVEISNRPFIPNVTDFRGLDAAYDALRAALDGKEGK